MVVFYVYARVGEEITVAYTQIGNLCIGNLCMRRKKLRKPSYEYMRIYVTEPKKSQPQYSAPSKIAAYVEIFELSPAVPWPSPACPNHAGRKKRRPYFLEPVPSTLNGHLVLVTRNR